MKKYLLPILSAIVGGLLLFFVFGNIGLKSFISGFESFSPVKLFIFIMLSFVGWIIASVRWKLILKTMGHHVPFLRLLKYNLMAYPASYIVPSAGAAGMPVKAVLMKNEQITAHEIVSSILIDWLTDVLMVVFLFSYVFLFLSFHFPVFAFYRPLAIGLVIIFLLTAGFFFLRMQRGLPIFSGVRHWRIVQKSGFLSKIASGIVKQEENYSSFLKKAKFTGVVVVMLSGISLLTTFVQIYYGLWMIKQAAPITYIPIIFAFVLGSFAIPVPGAIGTFEAGQYSAFLLLGLKPQIGIVLALLMRIRDIFVLFIGFYLLSHEGMNFLMLIKRKKDG